MCEREEQGESRQRGTSECNAVERARRRVEAKGCKEKRERLLVAKRGGAKRLANDNRCSTTRRTSEVNGVSEMERSVMKRGE